MRWDKNYSKDEVINDPVVIPSYGVTDEERAYWNAKQEALEYDAKPTAFSDKHLISGAVYNALEEYKLHTVQSCQDFYWSVAGGLAETRHIVIEASEAAVAAKEAAEIAADISGTNKDASTASASAAADSAQIASTSASSAVYSAQHALESSYDAEAWTKGTRNGTPVAVEDETYHNNAKYYSDLGRSPIDDTLTASDLTWSSNKLTVLFAGKANLENGKVPAAQLPSYVDDVQEYSSISEFPVEGESGKIYIAIDTGLQYRWSGTAYAIISESLALGETSSTAYAGDKGKQNADNIALLQNAVSNITTLIPSDATSSNKLATSDEVTSEITSHISSQFGNVSFTTSGGDVYINW